MGDGWAGLSEPEDDDDRRSQPTIAVCEVSPRTPHTNHIFTFEIHFKLPNRLPIWGGN